jgi:hypothetical protein
MSEHKITNWIARFVVDRDNYEAEIELPIPDCSLLFAYQTAEKMAKNGFWFKQTFYPTSKRVVVFEVKQV